MGLIQVASGGQKILRREGLSSKWETEVEVGKLVGKNRLKSKKEKRVVSSSKKALRYMGGGESKLVKYCQSRKSSILGRRNEISGKGYERTNRRIRFE